jgi:hypothetical protein
MPHTLGTSALPGSKTYALAAMIAAVTLVACNRQPEWKPDPPLAAAHIADDPYLTVPPHSSGDAVKQILEKTVTEAFFRSDFARLEAMAKYYRDSGARTPAGNWKLSIFYDALSIGRYGTRADDALFADAEKKDLNWIAAFPHSPTPYIVYGEQLKEHGWYFRGTGYGYTVTKTGWVKFRDYLARARAFLEKNKTIAADDPHWYCAMLEIALGQNWNKDQFEPLLIEGIYRFPYYYYLYLDGVRFYQPAWGGDVNDLDSFVSEAVARTSSKEGTTAYARIYTGSANAFVNVFKETRATWPKLFNALQGMRQLYPDPRNDNKFAYYACVAGDWVWTARMMPLIQNAPNLEIWRTRDYFDSCRNWALSGKIPAGRRFVYTAGPFH